MIRLAKPYITEEAIEKVSEVLRSGNLVQGQHVREFEAALEKYIGVKYVIVVSSGTAALHLSLIAIGIGPGDEVIVPAFTFPATANVVEAVGATPVLVDITLDDYCIDVTKIEEVITPRTNAIMPVHEFGQSADMDPIVGIAKKYGLRIIEDAACALGTVYKNKKAGTFGDTGCFSFHPRKAITTGEGGAIVTDNYELAEKIRSYRNHGISIRDKKINFEYAGLNYRMTDFQAVLGLTQLEAFEQIISARIGMVKHYQYRLSDIPWLVTPIHLAHRKMVYQTFHILIRDDVCRDSVIRYLKEGGVETNFGAYALNQLKYFRAKHSTDSISFPNATTAYNQGLSLPLSYELTKKEVTEITNKLKSFPVKN